MKSIFNYDNKFMQLLMTAGDMIILNFMFLLFSLPIVTIGAAQAGLLTGLRKLTDKEDDTSPAAAFMKGFSNGFTKITVAFSIVLVLIILSGYSAASVAFFDMSGVKGAPVVLSVISLCITAILQTMISAFHSKFVCTLGQLFKNSGLMILAHPLRSILMAALVWSPILLFLGDLRIFILITPLFITLYFSFTHLLANSLMRKPFDSLVKLMQERQKEAEVTE